MAMEITNNYNAYENVYATQKQQTEKKQAASERETSETAEIFNALRYASVFYHILSKIYPAQYKQLFITWCTNKQVKTRIG